MEITIEGRSFRAHRNILAAESPYLNALVTTTTMKERSGPIELQEIAGNTFASALEFMYSHETTLASQDELQPLLHAASLLRLPSLEAAVEAAIVQRLEPSSALHALSLAEHLSLPVLAAAAREIVKGVAVQSECWEYGRPHLKDQCATSAKTSTFRKATATETDVGFFP